MSSSEIKVEYDECSGYNNGGSYWNQTISQHGGRTSAPIAGHSGLMCNTVHHHGTGSIVKLLQDHPNSHQNTNSSCARYLLYIDADTFI